MRKGKILTLKNPIIEKNSLTSEIWLSKPSKDESLIYLAKSELVHPILGWSLGVDASNTMSRSEAKMVIKKGGGVERFR